MDSRSQALLSQCTYYSCRKQKGMSCNSFWKLCLHSDFKPLPIYCLNENIWSTFCFWNMSEKIRKSIYFWDKISVLYFSFYNTIVRKYLKIKFCLFLRPCFCVKEILVVVCSFLSSNDNIFRPSIFDLLVRKEKKIELPSSSALLSRVLFCGDPQSSVLTQYFELENILYYL